MTRWVVSLVLACLLFAGTVVAQEPEPAMVVVVDPTAAVNAAKIEALERQLAKQALEQRKSDQDFWIKALTGLTPFLLGWMVWVQARSEAKRKETAALAAEQRELLLAESKELTAENRRFAEEARKNFENMTHSINGLKTQSDALSKAAGYFEGVAMQAGRANIANGDEIADARGAAINAESQEAAKQAEQAAKDALVSNAQAARRAQNLPLKERAEDAQSIALAPGETATGKKETS